MEDQHSTFIQIPTVTDICGKKNCSIYTIPFRVCEEIIINKIRVMTIGPQQLFEKVIVSFPTFGTYPYFTRT